MLGLVLIIVGVFLGAFIAELLRRNREGFVHGVSSKVKYGVNDFRQGFKEGYRGEASRDDDFERG